MRVWILFALIGLLISSFCQTRSEAAKPAQSQHDIQLAEAIQQGNTGAISEAGRSGNRFFVPFLKRELTDRTHEFARSDARLLLAKLGEREQLQEQWCRSISESPTTSGVYPPIESFGYIGGWYSFQALQKLLEPEEEIHWNRAVDKYERKPSSPHDIQYLRPSYKALETLSKMVPDPPVKFSPEVELNPNPQAKIWQDWIAAHKDELSKLQPTGEGVDFSDSVCKNGKPRKKLR